MSRPMPITLLNGCQPGERYEKGEGCIKCETGTFAAVPGLPTCTIWYRMRKRLGMAMEMAVVVVMVMVMEMVIVIVTMCVCV